MEFVLLNSIRSHFVIFIVGWGKFEVYLVGRGLAHLVVIALTV